jgi:hypothetical protein
MGFFEPLRAVFYARIYKQKKKPGAIPAGQKKKPGGAPGWFAICSFLSILKLRL